MRYPISMPDSILSYVTIRDPDCDLHEPNLGNQATHALDLVESSRCI